MSKTAREVLAELAQHLHDIPAHSAELAVLDWMHENYPDEPTRRSSDPEPEPFPVAYEHLDGPSHYPGIPRQWVVTLESGRQLLVRFTDSAETDIEVAQRSNQYATWSIAEPGVPA